MACGCGAARPTCTDPVIDTITGASDDFVVYNYRQTVVGSGFTASSTVCVGGVSAEITSRSDTAIGFRTPNLGTGEQPTTVEVCNGDCSATYDTTYFGAL